MDTTSRIQDRRTPWEKNVTPRRAQGPSPQILGWLDGHNAQPMRSNDPFYQRAWWEGLRARSEDSAA